MATAQSTRTAPPETSIDNLLRRAAVVACGTIGVVVGAAAGFALLGPIGLVIGVVVLGGGGAAYGTFVTGRIVDGALVSVIARVDSHKLDVAEAPRLYNLLEGLCAVTGVQMPVVSVTSDEGINALTVADPARQRNAELVVTSGLVRNLERIEMEGVVAVCLARLRSGSAEAETLVTALTMHKPWFLTASTLRRLAETAHAGGDVFDTDVKGAGITRYPPGLAAAYQRMIDTSTYVAGFDANLANLWVADPRGESDVARNSVAAQAAGSGVETPTDSRPRLHERLALLREM